MFIDELQRLRQALDTMVSQYKGKNYPGTYAFIVSQKQGSITMAGSLLSETVDSIWTKVYSDEIDYRFTLSSTHLVVAVIFENLPGNC